MKRHIVRERTPHIARGYRIISFETPGMPELGLQINIAPRWVASVYAMRYRMISGWHRFEVTWSDDETFRAEARRIEEWLHARWFTSPKGRREYRRRHPECVDYPRRLV